jgi:hypothetical protein
METNRTATLTQNMPAGNIGFCASWADVSKPQHLFFNLASVPAGRYKFGL